MIVRVRAVLVLCVSLAFPAILSAQGESLDIRLFRQINNSQSNTYGAIEFVDQTSLPFFVSTPAGILLYGGLADDRSTVDTGTLLVVSQSLGFVTSSLLKAITDRQRPFEALTDVKLKRLSGVSGSSFPSGHATEAFAIATIFAMRSPPIVYVPAFVWAAFVGYGRVYVGVHYPSDVIAGMVLGTLCSVLVYEYREGILKIKDRFLNTANASVQYNRVPENTQLLRVSIPFH